MSHERIEQQLYDIDCTLHGILAALEKLAPQGSEREQIALRIFGASDFTPDESFEFTDAFIAERDRQRVRQAE